MFLSPDGRAGPSARATGRKGALPYLTLVQLSANSSKVSSTFTAHNYSATDILLDESGAWSALFPSRFVFPKGFLRITLQPQWATSAVGDRWAYVQANGSASLVPLEDNRPARNEGSTGVVSSWMETRSADYFETIFAQSSGGALNLVGSTTRFAQCTRVQFEWTP